VKYIKNKNFWIFLYVIFLVGSFIYVSQLLKTGTIDIDSKQDEPKAVEIKPVKVTLTLELNGVPTTYQIRSRNVDTVSDLMTQVKKDNNFTFEKTAYVDGVVISSVNGIQATQNMKWAVFQNDKDITPNLESTYLKDHTDYVLKLVQKTSN
jgi:hypothetical protein